ncbi:hypothetical protein QQ045_000184 [Rhodiola kirilowii]
MAMHHFLALRRRKSIVCVGHLSGKIQDALQSDEDEFKKITKINFMSAWFLLTAVGKRMRDSKLGGSIIYLTTIIGAERGIIREVLHTDLAWLASIKWSSDGSRYMTGTIILVDGAQSLTRPRMKSYM